MRKKHPRYLSEEQIQALADKCKTRSEFNQRFSGAYQQARKRGLLDKVCSHMVSPQKPTGYWTIDRLRDVASQYTIRLDFIREQGSAYAKIIGLGMLDELCGHMKKTSVKRIREASSDDVLKSIDNALGSSRRIRAVSWRFANSARREGDKPDLSADWTMQLYDQLAFDHEDRSLNHIDVLKSRGDHKAVDAAWQLFAKHMGGNWCTAAG